MCACAVAIRHASRECRRALESELAARRAVLSQREAQLQGRETALAEREAKLSLLEASAGRGGHSAPLQCAGEGDALDVVEAAERELMAWDAELAERALQLDADRSLLAMECERLEARERALTARQQRLTASMEARERRLSELTAQLKAQEAQLAFLRADEQRSALYGPLVSVADADASHDGETDSAIAEAEQCLQQLSQQLGSPVGISQAARGSPEVARARAGSEASADLDFSEERRHLHSVAQQLSRQYEWLRRARRELKKREERAQQYDVAFR